MTPGNEDQRNWMREQLQVAAEHFSVKPVGEPVFGWRARTIGSRVSNGDDDVWLRVSWAEHHWAEGNYWTGNKDAAAIVGVPKPTVLDLYEWGEEGYFRNRAEVMTLIHDRPCSETQELRGDLTLPAQWWHSLRDALDALSQHQTERTITSQETVSRRLLAFFGDQVDPRVDRWVTAHGDLNWSNLTAPNMNLLDWESFGVAPAGYDAATLYVLSLRVPDTAAIVHETFAAVLDSPDGVRSQLHVIGRFLKRVELGEFADMAGVWHHHARSLLGKRAGET